MRRRPDGLTAEQSHTQDDIKQAERSAEMARIRAARAARSAARSLEKTAQLHEGVAAADEQTVRQGASRTDVHDRSAAFHRQSAEDDHRLAEDKSNEADADES
ncbi:hypothetical protein H7J55_02620 [Mycolicibacterium brisbanense]|nr:hypothetical protein [Mycolicibacterium brisbanense]